jgi:biotin operon repressor
MNEPLALPEDSTNKKMMILRLLSEGKYSTKDIARIVGTTEAYVWKEKSKSKTAGLLVRSDTQVISKTNRLSIYSNNSLLNVPQLDTDGLRKLYGELLNGKKPEEIIAENGFHPELVESENQRFQRLVENNIDSLPKKFFAHFERDLLSTNNNTINLLLEKYKNDVKLRVDEFINLTRSLLNEKYRSGEASAIHNLINGNVPDGWEAVACLDCNKPIRGSIVDPAKTMWITLSYKNMPLSHGALGMPCA